MKKHKRRMSWWLLLAVGGQMLAAGCVTQRGMLTAFADDLALTSAAAVQGVVAGALSQFLAF